MTTHSQTDQQLTQQLLNAITNNRSEEAATLIKSGAKPCDNCLYFAVRNNANDTIALLLQHTIQDASALALKEAAQKGNFWAARKILPIATKNTDPQTTQSLLQHCLLSFAASKNDMNQAIQWAVKHGANPKDSHSRCLITASTANTKPLLDAGADPLDQKHKKLNFELCHEPEKLGLMLDHITTTDTILARRLANHAANKGIPEKAALWLTSIIKNTRHKNRVS